MAVIFVMSSVHCSWWMSCVLVRPFAILPLGCFHTSCSFIGKMHEYVVLFWAMYVCLCTSQWFIWDSCFMCLKAVAENLRTLWSISAIYIYVSHQCGPSIAYCKIFIYQYLCVYSIIFFFSIFWCSHGCFLLNAYSLIVVVHWILPPHPLPPHSSEL